jgi:siderophore synthetase component
MGKREDRINRQCAQAVAGHFDHYFCKDYTPSDPPLERPVAALMQASLIEAGVDPAATTLLAYGKSVFFEILSHCEPGDLLVYLIGNAEKAVIHGYVEEFRRDPRHSPWLADVTRAENEWFASLAKAHAGTVAAVRQRHPDVLRRALARTLLALGREGLLPSPPLRGEFECEMPGGGCRLIAERFSASSVLLRADLRRLKLRWRDGRIEVVEHPARLLEILAESQEADHSAWKRLAMEITDSVLNESLALEAHEQTSSALGISPGPVKPADIRRCREQGGPAGDDTLFFDQWAATGHPLHTVPKARLGLPPGAALALCPEFHPQVTVRLAAVRRERCCAELPPGVTSLQAWFATHDPGWLEAWRSMLADRGLASEDFEPFPVHPWQADHVLAKAFSDDDRRGEAVLFDGPGLPMLPCLSVRSMVPAKRPDGPGFKLALGVRLTSGVRTITPRSCHMGPRVGRLLRGFFEADPGYGGRADVVAELLGAHYRPPDDNPELAKHFSFIAREAVACRADPGDLTVAAAALAEPFPLGGLPLLLGLAAGASPVDGLSVYGAYARDYLDVILRTYLVYGIALEAHGQNTLASFDEAGRLKKILFRDLAGIRIHEPTLQRLGVVLEVHPDRRTVVQDFDDHRFWLRHRAYHCHLGHIAHELALATGVPEERYWALTGEITAEVFTSLRGEVDAQHWERERRALLDEPWTAKASLSMRLNNQVRDLPFTTRNPLRARPGAA